VIPHAGRLDASAPATGALVVAVIESTFGALAMTTAGEPKALGASLGRAARAAVDVAAVTALADGEDRLAARASR
jgi:hypothetical protein